MNNHAKKLLYYIAFSSLLNISFCPLYAGLTENDPFSQEEQKGIKRNQEDLSTSETKSSPLSKRHSKYAIGPIGNQFVINQNIKADTIYQSATSLTNGNVFVAWMGTKIENHNIYGRVFSPTGSPISNEFSINQNALGFQQPSSVVGLTNGYVFVAWAGSLNAKSDIYGRVFSSTGSAISNEFVINQATKSGPQSPSAASLTNGNVFVAWNDSQTGSMNIYGRVISPNGSAISNDFLINQVANKRNFYPSAASLTNGNVFVTWNGEQSKLNIYGRVFSPNGLAIGNEFDIDQNTSGTSAFQAPNTASLTNGNVFVAWNDYRFGNANIYGRVFSPTGSAIGNAFVINKNIVGNFYQSAAGIKNGNVIVAWTNGQSERSDIYGRVFSPTGSAIGDAFVINNNFTRFNYFPSAAGLTNGDVFVAWTGVYTGKYNVYGRIIEGQHTAAFVGTPRLASPRLSSPRLFLTSSANKLTPNSLLPIPAKIVMDEVKTPRLSLTSSANRLTPSSILQMPAKIFMGGVKTIQSGCNYAKSWFSSEAWSEYFDSMEKSVLDYSKSIVEETPSYHSMRLGESKSRGSAPLMSKVSYNSSLGAAGFLPYFVVSGAIGQ